MSYSTKHYICHPFHCNRPAGWKEETNCAWEGNCNFPRQYITPRMSYHTSDFSSWNTIKLICQWKMWDVKNLCCSCMLALGNINLWVSPIIILEEIYALPLRFPSWMWSDSFILNIAHFIVVMLAGFPANILYL